MQQSPTKPGRMGLGGDGRWAAAALALALATLEQGVSLLLYHTEPAGTTLCQQREALCLEHLFHLHLGRDSVGRASLPVLITCYQLQSCR